jgi:hypothetical protein
VVLWELPVKNHKNACERFQCAVAELNARGVVFEDYDAPGLHTRHGIADIEGN